MSDNVCEHGDHPAPEGRRFCSPDCERCEAAEHDATRYDCADICQDRFKVGHTHFFDYSRIDP